MEKLLNVKELCNTLNIHFNTVYKYIKLGMPCVKMKRGYRFNFNEVKEWMNNN